MKTTSLIAFGMLALAAAACDDPKRAQEKADQAKLTAGEVAQEGQQKVDKKAMEANEDIRKANTDAIEAQRKADEARVTAVSDYRTKVNSRIVDLEKESAKLKSDVATKTGAAKKSAEESLAKTDQKLASLKADAKDLGADVKDSWNTLKVRIDDDLK